MELYPTFRGMIPGYRAAFGRLDKAGDLDPNRLLRARLPTKQMHSPGMQGTGIIVILIITQCRVG